jgi:hypothetical protein
VAGPLRDLGGRHASLSQVDTAAWRRSYGCRRAAVTRPRSRSARPPEPSARCGTTDALPRARQAGVTWSRLRCVGYAPWPGANVFRWDTLRAFREEVTDTYRRASEPDSGIGNRLSSCRDRRVRAAAGAFADGGVNRQKGLTWMIEQAAVWDAISATTTATGTLIALSVAVVSIVQRRNDLRRHEREEATKSRTQARLVRTAWGNPGARPRGDGGCTVELPLANHSGRPILDVFGEIWVGGLTEEHRRAVHADIILPGPQGEEQWLKLDLSVACDDLRLSAWRVRWADADGRRWYVDEAFREPELFDGQPPRPH